jgi:DNA repair protein RadC
MNQFTFDFSECTSETDSAMAVSEQPQQRFETFGASALSDTELLAMILQGNGTAVERAVGMARKLISEAGSIAGLASWLPTDYRRTKGIGQTKASQLATLVEISRRMMAAHAPVQPMMNRADLVAAHFAPLITGLQIEKFWVMCLNRKSRLLKRIEITSGTATAALAHPREVFRAAIRESATGVVCVHNHPSGDPAPSAPDLQVTRQLREAAKTVDIQLLDHVIVGTAANDPLARGFYSFREAGML